MQLVNNDVAQVLERLGPLGVVRQNAGVQHVGIGKHHVGAFADGAAGVLRRVPVVGEGAEFGTHGVDGALEFGELVLGQRLGGEQIQRASAGIGNQALEHRQVVAQRLAGGGGRHYHYVASGGGVFERLGLVRVQLADAARHQRLPERWRQGLREVGKDAWLGGLAADGAYRRIRVRHPFLEARAMAPARPVRRASTRSFSRRPVGSGNPPVGSGNPSVRFMFALPSPMLAPARVSERAG